MDDRASELSDEDLVGQAVAGDSEAYGMLVERHRNAVYGLAFHLLGDFEDARDVAQDVFVRVFLNLGSLRDRARLAAWLRAVTANECRMRRRSHKPTQQLEEAHLPTARAEPSDTRLAVRQALQCLSPESRLTLTLFYLHSHSMAEIAAFLGVPISTVKSRLRDARARLKKEMREMVEDSFNTAPLQPDFVEQVRERVRQITQSLVEAQQSGDHARLNQILQRLMDDPALQAEFLRHPSLQRFTEAPRHAMLRVTREAARRNHAQVEPGHLLLALLEEDDSAAQVLVAAQVTLEAVRRELGSLASYDGLRVPNESTEGSDGDSEPEPPLSPGANQVLVRAAEEAKSLARELGVSDDIGSEALLLALCAEPDGVVREVLGRASFDFQAARAQVMAHLASEREKK